MTIARIDRLNTSRSFSPSSVSLSWKIAKSRNVIERVATVIGLWPSVVGPARAGQPRLDTLTTTLRERWSPGFAGPKPPASPRPLRARPLSAAGFRGVVLDIAGFGQEPSLGGAVG